MTTRVKDRIGAVTGVCQRVCQIPLLIVQGVST